MEQSQTDTLRAHIRQFVTRFVRDAQLRDSDDFFARGFVNSLFAMQLVMLVEQRFQVTVDSEDLRLDNFSSIDAIVRFVERKGGSGPAAP